MNYSNLKTNIETKPITIEFNDNTIEIKKYIPIEDEINLIETVLNESMTEQHYYNPLTLKMLFGLHILYNFTNIEFSEEDKANPTKLYDEVRATGLLQAVLNEILEGTFGKSVEVPEKSLLQALSGGLPGGDPDPAQDAAAAKALRAALSAVGPAIAKLPAKDRSRVASDIAARLRKGAPASATAGIYAALSAPKARDAVPQERNAVGKRIMAARNPHFKK